MYGTSAAPLASRHGDAVAPAVFTPRTAALAAAVIAQRRWSLPVAGLIWATITARLATRLRSSGDDVPLSWSTAGQIAARLSYDAARGSLEQSGALALRHWWPVVLPAAPVSPRVRRIVAVAAVADAISECRRVRPDLDPLSFLVDRRLDDPAYGAGVWTGAVRASLRVPCCRASADRSRRGDLSLNLNRLGWSPRALCPRVRSTSRPPESGSGRVGRGSAGERLQPADQHDRARLRDAVAPASRWAVTGAPDSSCR
uniref:Uncharacterized protein n=1 Tax=Janibacter limosus TaxID=53458 RepID=A0AC61U6E7_9MICO|nr:hypothetical protein [Janibacter limosus]